jgi:hypothetical protein
LRIQEGALRNLPGEQALRICNAEEAALDNDVLTIEEIEARYKPFWVLIAEPQTDDMQRLLSGKVIFHSLERDAVWQKALELKLDRIAVRYLGEYPEDMVLLL